MIEFTVATPYTTFFSLSLFFLLDKYQSSIRSGHQHKEEQDDGVNSVVFGLNLRPAFTLFLLAELLQSCNQTALTHILVVFPSLEQTTTTGMAVKNTFFSGQHGQHYKQEPSVSHVILWEEIMCKQILSNKAQCESVAITRQVTNIVSLVSIQFSFICIASIKIQNVFRHISETQSKYQLK